MSSSESDEISDQPLSDDEKKTPPKRIPIEILDKETKRRSISYLVAWQNEIDPTWVSEDHLIRIGAIELIAEYEKWKCDERMSQVISQRKEALRIDKNMDFEILSGFHVNNKIYYRVLFENGVQRDLCSSALQIRNGRKLIAFLENYVRQKAEESQ